jgi:hypothetical protein
MAQAAQEQWQAAEQGLRDALSKLEDRMGEDAVENPTVLSQANVDTIVAAINNATTTVQGLTT